MKKTCVFSSFTYVMYVAREHVAEKAISSQLKSFLRLESLGYLDGIKFSNKVMTDRDREEDIRILVIR